MYWIKYVSFSGDSHTTSRPHVTLCGTRAAVIAKFIEPADLSLFIPFHSSGKATAIDMQTTDSLALDGEWAGETFPGLEILISSSFKSNNSKQDAFQIITVVTPLQKRTVL